MGKKKIQAYCRLCGTYTKMTAEHIPPKSAFNDNHVIFEKFSDSVQGRYSKSPNGIKVHSICEKCNNLTGSWYGSSFVEWVQQGMNWLDRLDSPGLFPLPFTLKPLNVIKQIVMMTIGVMREERITYYSDLRRFVMNKEQKYLPPDFRVYVYLTNADKPRFSDEELVIQKVDSGSIEYVNAEIALPPYGYCVTSTTHNGRNSLAEYQKLCDISYFSHFEYDVQLFSYHLHMPFKEVNSPFPLDYRSREEVDRDLSK